eukprot:10160774-Lingulodinium_polyedra.AAC.1
MAAGIALLRGRLDLAARWRPPGLCHPPADRRVVYGLHRWGSHASVAYQHVGNDINFLRGRVLRKEIGGQP